MAAIPVKLLTHPQPGLYGAAAAFAQEHGQCRCDIDAIMRLAPVIPVIVIDDAAHARPLAEALVAGGLPALEVTLRTPAALDAIRGDGEGPRRRRRRGHGAQRSAARLRDRRRRALHRFAQA